jgi:putative ABC transport system permease protein
VLVGFDALRIHPLRTLLSVLGITIGCASLIATMAVSDGLMGFARDTIRKQTSVQVIVVSPRKAAYRDGQWNRIHDYPVFGPADVEALRAHVGDATAVAMVLSGRATARHRGVQHRVTVTLGSAALPDFGGVELGAGRFFSDMEADLNAPVVVVNHALARELSPGRDPMRLVGEEIHVRDRKRRVIGVLAATPFEDRENPSFSVIAPIASARALLEPEADGQLAPAIQLLAPSVEAVTDVHDAAADWLSRRYARWSDRVSVHVGLESLTQVEQAILLVKLFVGALVGISLLVGGIGIMNVLLASVIERTREIGIRKSVGARGADIHLQFLTEAVAIALAGAGVGLVLGALLATGVTAAFRALAEVPVYPVISPGAVAVSVIASSIVGLGFGTYPARRAARLSPIVAISHE